MHNKKTIVVGITGSIAAYKACDIVNCLKKQGYEVQVIMTECARHFVTPLTLQTLSGNSVYGDMFEPLKEYKPLHIALAKKADVVAIVPATAQCISKVASGICDDLLSCTIVSTQAPVLFAPAMNDQMYANPIIQENRKKLIRLGYHFVGPQQGHLACGTEGMGHIEENQKIIEKIIELSEKPKNTHE